MAKINCLVSRHIRPAKLDIPEYSGKGNVHYPVSRQCQGICIQAPKLTLEDKFWKHHILRCDRGI